MYITNGVSTNGVCKLRVHAYDWIIKDKYGDNDQTVIDCWALDNESNPYLLIIHNFPVFCFIELPFFNNQKREIRWTMENAKLIITQINTLLHNDGKILKSELLELQKLYYYQGDRKTKFLRVYFNNIHAMRQCKYKLDNAIYTDMGLMKLEMHEYDIDVVRKLLSLKSVKYSGWFEVDARPVEEELKISTLVREYRINWTSMAAISDEITQNWETRPGVLSWDIECYSDNPLAMPNRYHDKHVAYMISAIYKKYKDPTSYKRYGIIIGNCDQIPKEKLENCEIIQTEDECSMVTAFGKVIIDTDPEILVGYNIFSFDYPYLDHRIRREDMKWPKMSRLIGEVPYIPEKKGWHSNAYGHTDNHILIMSGRISIDLLPVVKRDYNMDTYTLNAVCLKFIQKEKNDVSPKQMFLYFEEMQAAIQGYKLNPNNETKKILERAVKNTTEVMEYCIKDSELVLELMEALDVWVGLVELSNIVGVTIVDIFTKGQQVRCVSQLYNLATSMGVVINKKLNETYHYKGGKVQDPVAGLHENIICLDFRSLYPSIIDAYNICYSTLVAKEHMNYVPDSECNVFEFDQDEEVADTEKKDDDERDKDEDPIVFKKRKKKVIVTKNVHYKFKFYKNKVGLLPTLVRNLVAQRNAVRKIQGNTKNPHVKMVLEKRQLALKVSANSFYGFLGVREGGKLPCIEAAMCVTARGRELITFVANHLENKYGASVIYGDTDTIHESTPILIRINGDIGRGTAGTVAYIQIKDLIKYGTPKEKSTYELDKQNDNGKQYFYIDMQHIEVWTDKGWSKIKYLMRHRNTKRMYRVLTGTGVVDVTEDHSLLNQEGKEVTVNDVDIGSFLLHKDLPVKLNNKDIINNITLEKAWVWGFFMAEGTSCSERYPSGLKNIVSLSNVDVNLLEFAKRCLKVAEPDYDFKIDDTMISSSVYKLNIRKVKAATLIKPAKPKPLEIIAKKYTSMFYTDRNEYITTHKGTDKGKPYKKVPTEIFMANTDIKRAFLNGWYAGDGDMTCLISYKAITHQDDMKERFISSTETLLKFKDIDGFTSVITNNKSYSELICLLKNADSKKFESNISNKINIEDKPKEKIKGSRKNQIKYVLINGIRTLLMYECYPAIIKNYDNTLKQKFQNHFAQTEVIVDNFIINFIDEIIIFIHNILNKLVNLNELDHKSRLIYQYIIVATRKCTIVDDMLDYIAHIKYYLYNAVEIEKHQLKLNYCNFYHQTTYGRFDIVGQIGAAGLYYVCNAIGLNVYLNDQKSDEKINKNTYRLTYKNDKEDDSDQIKKILPLGILDEDVFDIETENHHFAAGPGRMIVHNSVMVDLHIKDSKECQYWGELLAQEISGVKAGEFLPASKTEKHLVDVPGLFPSPLGTEYEKGMRLFCIKKKKYAAYLIGKDGTFKKRVIKDSNGIVVKELDELEMLKKGIVLARRDNNALLKDIYLKILNLIMNEGTFKQAFIILMDTIIQLKENKVDHMLLKSSRALGAHYKSESNFMHIFANELRKMGKLVNPGDRLEFLVIEKEGNPLVGYKMVLLCDYIDSLKTDTPMKLDYIHYIQKVLKNPIDQLFEIGFGVYLNKFKNITYTPARKRNPIYLSNPCKMAFHMMENGLDIIKFKNTVINYINYVENPVELNVI
jgi:DNA polymerase elongation subunit (family B)